MSYNLSDTLRTVICNAIASAIDSGTTNANGTIQIRTGVKPPNPRFSPSGSLIATIQLQHPSYLQVSAGLLTLRQPPAATALITGVAGWFRLFDRNNNALLDGDISAAGGTGSLQLNNTNILVGSQITLTQLTLNLPIAPGC